MDKDKTQIVAAVYDRQCGNLQSPCKLRKFGGNTRTMSAPKDELLQAVELALAGKWDAAHQIVQKYEDDATAAWIHAGVLQCKFFTARLCQHFGN